MQDKCLCEADEIMLFPCSGGSNCGQLSNAAAVYLDREGVGSMSCLAGIGGHVSGIVESARAAKRVVAIDGCSVACAKKTLEHVGIPVTDYVVVTELGIEKTFDLAVPEAQIRRVTTAVQDSLADVQATAAS